MGFLKKHERLLIVAISAFCIGYILGEIRQIYSFQQDPHKAYYFHNIQDLHKVIAHKVTAFYGKLVAQ